MVQQTKLEILRRIAVLAEELKGTEIAAEVEQVMKGKFSDIKREQLLDLKNRIHEEIKKTFLTKHFPNGGN